MIPIQQSGPRCVDCGATLHDGVDLVLRGAPGQEQWFCVDDDAGCVARALVRYGGDKLIERAIDQATAREERREELRDVDGQPRPLAVGQIAPGDWACALWHAWPASLFPAFPAAPPEQIGGGKGGSKGRRKGPRVQRPKCPLCGYSLWHVRTVESGGRVTFRPD